MTTYEDVKKQLAGKQYTWCITGVAGFIGSNLLESLLKLNQKVVGLDNFSTGHKKNLDEVKANIPTNLWENFSLIQGDIRNIEDCKQATSNAQYVLHQAALGSVPRSLNDPTTTNEVNIGGHLNMLIAARDANVNGFVYAASSSTYGDHPALPKVEENIGNPLSPYAVTKYVNELYGSVFDKAYGFKSTGLRYFNVFGPRQDPNGAYAAVIPLWTAAIIAGETIFINGDGETSRDFCFVENAVQANLLAAVANEKAKNQVYNVAVGERTTLNELFSTIKKELNKNGVNGKVVPSYRDFRLGDVKHSQADVTKAKDLLGYIPEFKMLEGIQESMPWYIDFIRNEGT